MKKVLCSFLPVLTLALIVAMVSGAAFAQTVNADGDDYDFSTNYFSNNINAAPAATVRITNFGEDNARDLCALIYVFSADQELQSCCGCRVTANGLQTINVNTQLLGLNGLGKITPVNGVIQVISSEATGTNPLAMYGLHNDPSCDPTRPSPAPALVTWVTHIQKVGTAYPITETQSHDSDTDFAEFVTLATDCGVDVAGNGSGFGVCDCGPFESGGSQRFPPK